MTTTVAQPPAPEAGEEALALRPSAELARVPTPRPPAPAVAPAPGPAAESAAAGLAEGVGPAAPAMTGPAVATWLLAGTALVATFGWIAERKRRRLLEVDKDSVLWADVQPPGSSIVTTAGGLDDILPDSPDPAESARAIYVTAIGETNSRREATLIDLHQLDGKLVRRRARGDIVAAVLLLQQHLVDFRYTSPWVFLELRGLYKLLDRQREWEVAREAFRNRFGQNAPVWAAPSTEALAFVDDAQLCGELVRKWPQREARMFVLRWMLGEHDMRQKCSGPPLLGLGVYRDMMFVDTLLDEVMVARAPPADSLL